MQWTTSDFLQRATSVISNERILQRATSDFLQRATSATSNERILQWVTSDFTMSNEQRVKIYASGDRWLLKFQKKEKKECLKWVTFKMVKYSCRVLLHSILGPILFLIYINGLSGNLDSNPELFADDTSLFLVVHDINQSRINLNDDLEKISNWASQWKKSFKPTLINKCKKIFFSRKLQKPNHPYLTFNGTSVYVIWNSKILANVPRVKTGF